MRLYLFLLVAGIVAIAGVLVGLWWAPFVVGLALGIVVRRGRIGVPIGAAIGLLAWLAPLAIAHESHGLGLTATSLAAIMGFDHQPAVPLTLTLLLGTLLGLTGAWLGASSRGVVTSVRSGT